MVGGGATAGGGDACARFSLTRLGGSSGRSWPGRAGMRDRTVSTTRRLPVRKHSSHPTTAGVGRGWGKAP